MNRGKLLILLMVLTGLVCGGFGVWYQHRQTHRITDAFSTQVAMLVAYAPSTEIIKLEATDNPAPSEFELVHIHDRPYRLTQRQRLETSPEFAKVRKWLVRDENYSWDMPSDDASWQFLIDFTDGSGRARLAFDLRNEQLILLPDGPVLSTRPMSGSLHAFFAPRLPGLEGKTPARQ